MYTMTECVHDTSIQRSTAFIQDNINSPRGIYASKYIIPMLDFKLQPPDFAFFPVQHQLHYYFARPLTERLSIPHTSAFP